MPKKKTAKKKMGRPTKYVPSKVPFKEPVFLQSMVARVNKIAEDLTLGNFFDWCGIESIALALDVRRDTIWQWGKKYPDFSDAIKKWEEKRNHIFYRHSSKLPPGVWVFIAKNWLAMRDTFDTRLTGGLGGEGQPDLPVTIKIVTRDGHPNKDANRKQGKAPNP
jgi:hypothetical protein